MSWNRRLKPPIETAASLSSNQKRLFHNNGAIRVTSNLFQNPKVLDGDTVMVIRTGGWSAILHLQNRRVCRRVWISLGLVLTKWNNTGLQGAAAETWSEIIPREWALGLCVCVCVCVCGVSARNGRLWNRGLWLASIGFRRGIGVGWALVLL